MNKKIKLSFFEKNIFITKILIKTINIFSNNKILNVSDQFNPFFIIGSGRSGNTLLRRILNSNSTVCIPPETYVLSSIINKYICYNFFKKNDLINIIYSTIEYHKEFKTYGIENLIPLVHSVKYDSKKTSLAYLINKFYEYYGLCNNLTIRRWGDKTPTNTFAVNRLSLVFKDSLFIHIIRNPYDSISSYIESGIYKDIESATQRWIKSISHARNFGQKNKERYYEVYYEDLVRFPDREVEKICFFLKINY